jgi:hypothetical protein
MVMGALVVGGESFYLSTENDSRPQPPGESKIISDLYPTVRRCGEIKKTDQFLKACAVAKWEGSLECHLIQPISNVLFCGLCNPSRV